jgi:hypothetical protein
MTGERGSATVLIVGLAAVVVFLGLLVADAAVYLRGRVLAATAADAAALASAPVTFHGFGTTATPETEAGRFAIANGAVLDRCECPVDRSWRPRTVEVTVSVSTSLFLFGNRSVAASSNAEFHPIRIARPAGVGVRSSTRSGGGIPSRRHRREGKARGGVGHALVVGDDAGQVVAERHRCGEMDGVERP